MFHEPLKIAWEHAEKYLNSLDSCPVGPRATLADLQARLDLPLANEGIPAAQVVDDLARGVEGGLMAMGSGRFFGWVIGGALPSALAADWLTSAWDQNAGIFNASPAAALVEEIAARWIKDLLGLPADASFAFVTGCQMAHVTCLAAARHGVLSRAGWDVESQGLSGAPPLRVLATADRHGSVDRAVRLLGIGTASIQPFRPESGELQARLEENAGNPVIVVLQAGDVNTGVFDDLAALIPVARRAGAWVHVDGAFGLWAGASPSYRHLVAGAGAADSWATDGHKWLNVPYDCGYAFVADPQSHRAAMSYSAGYLPMSAAGRDQIDWTPEFSRRARGFATYAALRELGREGVARVVDNCCRAARDLVAGLSALRGVEVLAVPVINQGLVRFPDPEGRDHDAHTDRVIAAIQQDGEAWFGGTTWRGMRAMRISASNWLTGASEVERSIQAVARALEG